MPNILTRRVLTAVAAVLAATVLAGCGGGEPVAEDGKLDKILSGIDEYNGYGPTVIKVRQGIAEAEIAITEGFGRGIALKDMTFDYFNSVLARSSAYPGTIDLAEVYGGLHPIMSVTPGEPLIVAMADDSALCYYLRATVDDGKVVFTRGMSVGLECRAGAVPKYTSWSKPGVLEYPSLEELFIPEEVRNAAPPAGSDGMQPTDPGLGTGSSSSPANPAPTSPAPENPAAGK